MADDMAPLPDEPGTAADDEVEPEGEPHRRGLLDRMRGMGVGTEDPNIVGDAGPTDVPPGSDPPADPIGPVDT